MLAYKIYTVISGGRIREPPVVLDFEDDLAAIRYAEALKVGVDIEVWEGRRRVALLKAAPHDLPVS
jgi:hypothetical protein